MTSFPLASRREKDVTYDWTLEGTIGGNFLISEIIWGRIFFFFSVKRNRSFLASGI